MANTLIEQPVPQSLRRWRGAVGINWKGMALVGDAFSNVIGLSDFAAFTEYGETMRFLITTPPLHEDRKRIFIPRFEIEVEAGQGFPPVPSPSVTTTYCANGVTITSPTTLTTAGALANMPANVAAALLSVWLDLAAAAATGMVLSSGSLSLKVQNNGTGTPQMTLSVPGTVVATYDFTAWPAWVNVMLSIDTATQRLQVWANTLVAGVLVEDELTPVSLAWASVDPIANIGPWQISVV